MSLLRYLFVPIFASLAAHAEPVSIRTGEHEDFTRIVLFLQPDSDWQIGRNADGYVLRTSVTDGYDLNGFFDFIPRTRIAGVSQRPDRGELNLIVSCICNAKAYLFQENILVVDVRDGPPNRIGAAELKLPPMQDDEIRNRAVATVSFQNRFLPLVPEQFGEASVVFSAEQPRLFEAAEADRLPVDDLVENIEAEITLALGRGLSGRLLDEGALSRFQSPDFRPNIGLNAIEALPGVEARTSLDPLSRQIDVIGRETQTGRECLPEGFFDVHSWGDERSFNEQIGAARLAVYQEFDRVDDVALTKLAKNYLFFGFGREALQTLQLDLVQSQERRYLSEIAKIIDEGDVDSDAFAEQVSCPSPVAMWAMLALDGGENDAKASRDHILQSFKKLPSHLQQILGPRLSRSFVRIGDLDASKQVLARSQMDGIDISENGIAQSELSSAMHDDVRAIAALAEVVKDSPRTTPTLMARFLEGKRMAEVDIADEELDLADAIRFEARGSQSYVELTAEQIRAHLSVDQFDRAREILLGGRSTLPAELWRELDHEFSAAAVDRMQDAEFGRHVWSGRLLPQSQQLQEQFSERLEEMGFPQKADTLRVSMLAVPHAKEELGRSSVAKSQAGQGRDNVLEGFAVESSPAAVNERVVQADSRLLAENITLGHGRSLVADSAKRREDLERRLNAISIPES